MNTLIVILVSFQYTFTQTHKIIDLIDSEISNGKRLISFGEMHQYKPLYSLFDEVFKSKKIQKNIDVIVIEFGNSFYQNILDRYIAGESVSMDSVRLVWRNTLVSPNTVWDSPIYEDFIKSIREINEKLDPANKFRVIAGDKNINWKEIKSRDDMTAFYSKSRSEYIFETVRKEVYSKNKRAILIAGGVHTSKISVQNISKKGYKYNNVSIGALIDFYYPETNFVINSLKKLPDFDKDAISKIKAGSIIETNRLDIKTIPANKITSLKNYDGSKFNGYLDYTLHDMADAIIYWGPIHEEDYARPEKEIYLDDTYWFELNRRSQLLWNRKINSSLRE